MTKKHFAFIMTALEQMKAIQDTTTMVTSGNVTKAYASCKEMKTATDKFLNDFGDVNPRWTPANASGKTKTQMLTKKQFAFIMTALEQMKAIQETVTMVTSGNMTKAYASCKDIKARADKFMNDFGDINPRWNPSMLQEQTPQVVPVIVYETENQ